MREFLVKNWGKIALLMVLVWIVAANFREGYYILGNDNYSPELNPSLSLKRFIESPAWRGYRVLGVASDADQADLPRTILFWLLEVALPGWLVSQGYIWLCLVAGVWSVAVLTSYLSEKLELEVDSEVVFLVAGCLVLGNLLTIWMFYSPLIPFMATWAFLPLVLWRMLVFVIEGRVANWWKLLGAMMLMTTSGIVPTIFIVEMLVLAWWSFGVGWWRGFRESSKRILIFWLSLLVLNSFWMWPFVVYVKTSSAALQQSFINRKLTPEMIEGEVKYNQMFNVPRYLASWIDVRNDNGSWWYGERGWYRNNKRMEWISFGPLVLAGIGVVGLIVKRKRLGWMMLGVILAGWWLIKGINPPWGQVYSLLQKYIPLFEQVFRWQSSKLWPMLATSMPIVGAIAVGLVIKRFRWVKWPLLIVVIVMNVYIGWPMFVGKFIGDRSYVKIPDDYSQLSAYLTDIGRSRERMYLAPEANTLYFRNYDYGFFGSSLLNYLLLNPIVEMALTTGSVESESAQRLITKSMYSGDVDYFVKAMRRYNVGLVLVDGHATRLENGYRYNWDLINRLVKDGEHFKLLWQEGKLKLYEVERINEGVNEVVAEGHNWERLNAIKIMGGVDNNYRTDNGGNIYPFAWNYDEVKFGGQAVVLSGKYWGQGFDYRVDYGNNMTKYWKLTWNKEIGGMIAVVEGPKLRVDGNEVLGLGRSSTIWMAKGGVEPKYVSINDRVMPIRDGELKLKEVDRLGLKWWGGKPVTKMAKMEVGSRPYMLVDRTGVILTKVELSNTTKSVVNICIWLEKEEKCINNQRVATLDPGSREIELIVDRIVNKGDKLTFYIDSEDGGIKVDNIEVDIYGRVDMVISRSTVLGETNQWWKITPGDRLELELPILADSNLWQLAVKNNFGPELSTSGCQNFYYDDEGGAIFRAKDCWGGIYSQFEVVDQSETVGMLVYRAENVSGIPLDIKIERLKGGEALYDQRIGYKKESVGYDYVLLPNEWQNYVMKVNVLGIGPRESINYLNGLKLVSVPNDWLGIKLVSMVVDDTEVPLGINQAVSDSWSMNGGDCGARINGWEQGWRCGSENYVFWPNMLAWVGYGAVIGMLLAGLGLGIKEKLGDKKNKGGKGGSKTAN